VARDSKHHLDQHHADMYAMLQMQRRLIAVLREALIYGVSNDWLDRAKMLIEVAEIRADIMKITDRSENENQNHRTRDTVRLDRTDRALMR
jgi:hypothetical protein